MKKFISEKPTPKSHIVSTKRPVLLSRVVSPKKEQRKEKEQIENDYEDDDDVQIIENTPKRNKVYPHTHTKKETKKNNKNKPTTITTTHTMTTTTTTTTTTTSPTISTSTKRALTTPERIEEADTLLALKLAEEEGYFGYDPYLDGLKSDANKFQVEDDEKLARRLQLEQDRLTVYRQTNTVNTQHQPQVSRSRLNLLLNSDRELSYEELLTLDDISKPVSKNCSTQQIASLPTRIFMGQSSASSCSCSICLTDYDTGDQLRSLPCFHSFHIHCIDKWLSMSKTCPTCKNEILIT